MMQAGCCVVLCCAVLQLGCDGMGWDGMRWDAMELSFDALLQPASQGGGLRLSPQVARPIRFRRARIYQGTVPR